MREKKGINGVIRKKRTWLAACVLSMTLMTSSVFAYTESDPYPTAVHNGYSYNIKSVTSPTGSGNNKYLEGITYINKSSSSPAGNVPNGYMGAQARLFSDTGLLKASSAMVYNQSPLVQWTAKTSVKPEGTYYSQGKGNFYNTNGTYTLYEAYASPKYTLSYSNFSLEETSEQIDNIAKIDKYAVNRNGDTFGSALSSATIGYDPDLISAVGTNGIQGYVKSTDLDPVVDSLEAALAQNKNSNRTIPLYDVNGETQIGEFKLVTLEP